MTTRAFLAAGLLAAVAAFAAAPGSSAVACRETTVSPEPPNAWMGTLSTHWLRSGTVWMGFTRADRAFVARPNGQKIPWYRAAGSPWGRLRVTGTRLDGEAPPLRFSTRVTYPFRIGFQPSTLTFPSEGCWRIDARVGLRKRFAFVVWVEPDDGRP